MDRPNRTALAQDRTTYVDPYPYLVPITVVDLWVFRGVTDPPKNGRLASVCAPDDKDSEAAKLFLKVLKVLCVLCRHSETESVQKNAVYNERFLGWW